MATNPNELKQEPISDGSLFITKVKVDGGYVVNSFDKSHQILGSCFVPDLRTQLAAMAMSKMAEVDFNDADPIEVAEKAVIYADKLIDELNKEKTNVRE